MASDPPWADRAVLFYGSRKAGTTLLRSLMDGGERLFVYPNDVKFKQLEDASSRTPGELAAVYFRQWNDQLRDPIAEKARGAGEPVPPQTVAFGGLDLDPSTELLDVSGYLAGMERLRQDPPATARDLLLTDVRTLLEALPSPPAAMAMWGAKEGGGSPARVFPYFRSLFREGRVVVIVRHPGFVIRSIVCDRRRRGMRLGPYQLVRQTAIAERDLLAYDGMAGDPGVYFVIYEDVVKDRDAAVAGICRFLGLAPADVHGRPTTLGESIVVRTASRPVQGVFDADVSRWSKGLRWWEAGAIGATSWAYRTLARVRSRRSLAYPSAAERLRKHSRAVAAQAEGAQVP